MQIIGNVDNKDKMLIANQGGFHIVSTSAVRSTIQQKGMKTVNVANLGNINKELKADSAITKTGLIGKRSVTPLLLQGVQSPEVLGDCIINGINLGNVLVIKAMSYEVIGYNSRKGYVPRVIVYLPKIDVCINCNQDGYNDLAFMLMGTEVFKLARGVEENGTWWTYGIILENELDVTSGRGDMAYRLLEGLEEKGILKFPCLNLSKQGLASESEKGTKLSGYIGELEYAWEEMLTGDKANYTRYRVTKPTSNSYRISYYTDYDRVREKVGVTLEVRYNSLRLSNIVGAKTINYRA